MGSGPLSHIRVLDLSRVMAGPWATQIFADLGADVIKVERPGEGDDTRGWGPPFVERPDGGEGDSGYFLSVNRGKRSIAIDLADPAGQEEVRKLAARSDIVFENFRAGTLARYGLDAASLHVVNPRLIYVSITGFGADGPRRGQVAYDFMIQAMGGLMSVTGVPDGAPGAGPQKVGIPIIDIMTGMYAGTAALAALEHRSQTGQGEVIDIAMLDVATAMLANQAMNHLIAGTTPTRTGNAHPNIQPQDVYPCASGHIVLAVGNDVQFERLATVLGQPALAADPRFRENRARVANVATLNAILIAAFAEKPMAEWVVLLGEAGVPCGPINTIADVMAEPQVRHREMVRGVPYGADGDVPTVVSPMRFAGAPLKFDRGPPLLDEHGEQIRATLLSGHDDG